MMTSADLRRIFETVLPEEQLLEFSALTEFQQRDRHLHPVTFLRAMIIAAATKHGGRQAEVMRTYFELGAKKVARASFYARFNEKLEMLMENLSRHTLEYVKDQTVDLPKWCTEQVQDFHIVDSSTVTLHKDLQEAYPGTGDYAALKIHKRFSLGRGTTIGYHLSCAKDHDSKHLTIDGTWRGLGLLADLAYASFQRLKDCEAHDVRYVIRLKKNWKPKVKRIARGEVKKTFLKDADFDCLLQEEVLALKGRCIDLDVTLGQGKGAFASRLVGVSNGKGGYHFYLTNLPRKVGPLQIADLYRARWEIEQDNKLDKSCHNLDEIHARTPESVRALVHACLISSILVCLIAHEYRLSEKPKEVRKVERSRAPIHPQSMARAMGTSSTRIAAALMLEGEAAEVEWAKIWDYLLHLGQDPNWRRSPSVMDQMRGWKISKGRPKYAKKASRAS